MAQPKMSEFEADEMSLAFASLWFDPWLILKGGKLKPILEMAMGAIAHQEEHTGMRSRKRRADDQRNLEQMVETVIANLARAALLENEHSQWMAVSLTKSKTMTRYDRHIFGKLPHVLRLLGNEGFLLLRIPIGRGMSSTVCPAPWFLSKLRECNATLDDMVRHPAEENIQLARSSWGFNDAKTIYGKRRELINYINDTKDSARFREEMRMINRHLSNASITMAPEYEGPPVDTTRKQLRRSFSLPMGASAQHPAFTHGGRLFGAFWQNIPKADRRFLRITGSPVVDLDFASMFPRLACLHVGIKPPSDDIYSLPGVPRAAVKSAVSALLFAEGQRERMPSEIKALLPNSITMTELRERILSHHPFMAQILEKGLGLQLMFTESQIMVATLLDLCQRGITGLGMHDGLMVASQHASDAIAAMKQASRKIQGMNCQWRLREAPRQGR
jgi:hypothetical protein